jgi:hypothetical protein
MRRRGEGAVITYLCSLGADESTAATAWIAVQLAVGRYSDLVNAGRATEQTKIHINAIAHAAGHLVKAIEKAPGGAWDHLAGEATRTITRSQFEADVRMVRDSAKDALDKLRSNGRPTSARVALVDELAVIWSRATGKMPTASGEGSFGAPRSHFGQFVALAASAKPGDFEDGFANLLVNAVTRYKKRNPKRVAKPSERI